MTLDALLAPTYIQMLGALARWLDKAEAAGGDERLLLARLAPDMFPLATQVRFACRQALEGMTRLGDRPLPAAFDVLLAEGRNAAEHPGSFADARARIAETIATVETLAADAPAIEPDAALAHTLPQGMVFDFTALQFARDWALPQFYFHVMTAYAILRANGVELGKADYAAHMFAYLRPGTAPS